MKLTVIPENIRRCMQPETRKVLNAPTNHEIALKVERQMERDLHKHILNFLRIRGVKYCHHAAMNRPTTCKIGTPDFMFSRNFIPVALEAKVGTNKLTVEQMEVRLSMIADGWRYYEVRSLDDVKRALDEVEK